MITDTFQLSKRDFLSLCLFMKTRLLIQMFGSFLRPHLVYCIQLLRNKVPFCLSPSDPLIFSHRDLSVVALVTSNVLLIFCIAKRPAPCDCTVEGALVKQNQLGLKANCDPFIKVKMATLETLY